MLGANFSLAWATERKKEKCSWIVNCYFHIGISRKFWQQFVRNYLTFNSHYAISKIVFYWSSVLINEFCFNSTLGQIDSPTSKLSSPNFRLRLSIKSHSLAWNRVMLLQNKGRCQKELRTDIVKVSLSPLTPLPLGYIVNKKIENIGEIFTLPSYSHYRE